MAGLEFHPEMDAVRQRLTTWWQGGDIGRPALNLKVPRTKAVSQIPEVAKPANWDTWYSTKDMNYRVYQGYTGASSGECFAEAVPETSPDLAPNCLALFLGCQGHEGNGTVWVEPCMDSPEQAQFEYDPDNFYWKFCLELNQRLDAVGRGKFLQQFPDLIEGLDTLAAMRGTQPLLTDLIERPEWVQECLRKITDLYFRYYDMLYDRMRDEVGGSIFWLWGPGRTAKFQCDFSAMISPRMFKTFMVPVLTEMCERVSYPFYHWDGPGAIPHLDHLLSIKPLKMIQWTSGAGVEPATHPRWWPLFHRILDGGKNIFLHCEKPEEALALKKEFGARSNRFYFSLWLSDEESAREFIKKMST